MTPHEFVRTLLGRRQVYGVAYDPATNLWIFSVAVAGGGSATTAVELDLASGCV